jgi:hypothetical protein
VEGDGVREELREFGSSPRFGPGRIARAAMAALALAAGCSLDWSHVSGDDADGPADVDAADVPPDDTTPDAEADSPADADADVDDAPAETDAGCGDAGPCVDDLDPCNGTERCNPSTGACERLDAPPDGTACAAGGGRCCGHVCRLGADCCSDADCPTACTGAAAPCAAFGDPPTCLGQDGCHDATGVCATLGARNCNSIAEAYCADCGCAWDPVTGGGLCVGEAPLACFGLDEGLCTNCIGCTWNAGVFSCNGTPTACGVLTDEPNCLDQTGCSWFRRNCNASGICV